MVSDPLTHTSSTLLETPHSHFLRVQHHDSLLFIQSSATVNAELFTLTYGALVAQLVRDHEDVARVNVELVALGERIGARLIDEFLAKTPSITSCTDFRETAKNVKLAFRTFLNVSVDIVDWTADGKACTIAMKRNPLEDFVELPASCVELSYSGVLCGAITSALRSVNVEVDCAIATDALRGDDLTRLRLSLKQMLKDELPEAYKDEG